MYSVYAIFMRVSTRFRRTTHQAWHAICVRTRGKSRSRRGRPSLVVTHTPGPTLACMAVTDALPIVQCPGCKEAMVVVEQQPAPDSKKLLHNYLPVRVLQSCEHHQERPRVQRLIYSAAVIPSGAARSLAWKRAPRTSRLGDGEGAWCLRVPGASALFEMKERNHPALPSQRPAR
jgi:hypothetical protein